MKGAEGVGLLEAAVKFASVEVVRWLARKGANTSVTFSDGFTPLTRSYSQAVTLVMPPLLVVG